MSHEQLEKYIDDLNKGIINAELVYFITNLRKRINHIGLENYKKILYGDEDIKLSDFALNEWKYSALCNIDFFMNFEQDIINFKNIDTIFETEIFN